jgi:hypothetical protein
MAEAKKKKILDLPIKLFFNDEGINYFIKNNKKLQKFKLADDVERYGIYFQQFSPALYPKVDPHQLRLEPRNQPSGVYV